MKLQLCHIVHTWLGREGDIKKTTREKPDYTYWAEDRVRTLRARKGNHAKRIAQHWRRANVF